MGVALSGSRAGLVSLLLLVATQLLKKPSTILITIIFLAIVPVLLQSDLTVYLDRHEVLLSGSVDDTSTNGRVSIWLDYVKYLNQQPIRWIIGCGLGSSIDIKDASPANAAHMLPLQIIAELGIIGLVVFFLLTIYIMQPLILAGRENSAMVWCSVALLFSCATQETFYPMPAMGFFPGFYLVALALTISITKQRSTIKGTWHR